MTQRVIEGWKRVGKVGLLLGAALLITAWVWAQGGAPAPGGEASSDETAAGVELETFVPSEDVAADQAVAFPVDI